MSEPTKGDLFVRVHGQVPYRNPARIHHMVSLMLAVWALEGWTDMRMGQLLSAAAKKGGWDNGDIFYCEEEVFAAGFVKILNEEMEGGWRTPKDVEPH